MTAFTAYLGATLWTVPAGTKVVYDKVLTNEGSHYDKGTGIFTVPTSGLYFFNVTVETKMHDGVQGEIYVHLMVNGQYKVDAIAKSFSEQLNQQSSNSAVLKLEAGQKVWIETYQAENKFFEGSVDGTGYVFNSFTGYRIA